MKRLFLILLSVLAWAAPAPAQVNINAAQITSGTVPFARLPTLAPANPLRKTHGTLQALSAGTASTQLDVVNLGDSLAVLKWRFIAHDLRRTYGTAGLGGLFEASAYTFPRNTGSPVYTSANTDYTKTPTGGWTTLASSGQAVGCSFGGGPNYNYPFAPPINPDIGVEACTRVQVYYVQEPGAGTFDVQVSQDLTSWTTVDAGVSAAGGSTTITFRTTTIASQQVRAVRALWASGTTKVWAARAWSTTANGVVLTDLSSGGIDMASFASCPGLAAVLNGLAPDLVTIEARDNTTTTGLRPALQAIQALWSTVPERIYMGMAQWAADSDAQIAAYNTAIRAEADATGALFFDSAGYFGNYAASVAAGYIVGGGNDHPNDKGSAYAAGFLARDMGLVWPLRLASARPDRRLVGGVLFSQVDSNNLIASSGATETDLMSYTIPGGLILKDGDMLVITAKFNFNATAANKRARCYLGGSVIADSGVVTLTNAGMEFSVTVWKAGNRCVVARTINFFNAPARADDFSGWDVNLNNPVVIKFTGLGTASGQVAQNALTIEYRPAP